jgi:creatinine amidohydrolase/Fe(II)-dependent formamide hydrolase-like protein
MNTVAPRVVFRITYLLLFRFIMLATPAFAQIHQVKEMNTEQIKALDREKTVALLPVGILEEHGPYLPSGTDGYAAERRSQDLANAIVEKPGWKVLIFPIVPLGTARLTSPVKNTHSQALTPCALRPCELSLWISAPT